MPHLSSIKCYLYLDRLNENPKSSKASIDWAQIKPSLSTWGYQQNIPSHKALYSQQRCCHADKDANSPWSICWCHKGLWCHPAPFCQCGFVCSLLSRAFDKYIISRSEAAINPHFSQVQLSENRLRKLGLFSPEKRMLCANPTAPPSTSQGPTRKIERDPSSGSVVMGQGECAQTDTEEM